MSNAGVRASAQIGKTADPSCYDALVGWETNATGCLTMWRETMTKKQLEKFVKIRNASGFSANLQFQIDADEAGFDIKELGDPTKLNGNIGYMWDTPAGRLVELHGVLTIYQSNVVIDMRNGRPLTRATAEERFA